MPAMREEIENWARDYGVDMPLSAAIRVLLRLGLDRSKQKNLPDTRSGDGGATQGGQASEDLAPVSETGLWSARELDG
jgi:hypothetical protein